MFKDLWFRQWLRDLNKKMLKRVDHMNLQVPPDREEQALSFYRDLIGLRPLKKPDSLGPGGGHFCVSEEPWCELHVGVARGTSFRDVSEDNALRNHLAFQVDDLIAVKKKFADAGVEIIEAKPAFSLERDFYQDRFFIRDPGGNLLEILEPRRPYSSANQ